jgi:regulator of replication initiation timing
MDVRKREPMFAQLAPERHNLETVRALHQTVVSLRVALDNTRAELQLLRDRVQSQVDTNVYVETIEKLSLENHILRQRVLSRDKVPEYVAQPKEVLVKAESEATESDTKYMDPPKCEEVKDGQKIVNDESVEEVEVAVQPTDSLSEKEKGDSPEKSNHKEPSVRSMSEEDQSLCSETSQHEVGTPRGSKTAGESDNESEDRKSVV